MKVNFYATLRQITGAKTLTFPLPTGTTVQQLVDAIIERFPPMHAVLLNPEGELYGHVHVFVNGRDTPFLENMMETVLSEDDKLDVFPAVGGG